MLMMGAGCFLCVVLNCFWCKTIWPSQNAKNGHSMKPKQKYTELQFWLILIWNMYIWVLTHICFQFYLFMATKHHHLLCARKSIIMKQAVATVRNNFKDCRRRSMNEIKQTIKSKVNLIAQHDAYYRCYVRKCCLFFHSTSVVYSECSFRMTRKAI